MLPLKARIIPFQSRDGYQNMAVDEYLLTRHGPEGIPVLRFYGWQPPAITIGRYQSAGCLDLEACKADGIGVVRRITGGGAIFHDCEVTYSLVWPETETHLSVGETFEKLNMFLIESYRSLGLEPRYAKNAGRGTVGPARRGFCFSGNEEYDILVDGKKIGGNAQRRVRGAVLQHGSIPLSLDPVRIGRYFRVGIDAWRFTSLREACSRDIEPDDVVSAITGAFARIMNIEIMEQSIEHYEEEAIRSVMTSRYALDRWNLQVLSEGDDCHETGLD